MNMQFACLLWVATTFSTKLFLNYEKFQPLFALKIQKKNSGRTFVWVNTTVEVNDAYEINHMWTADMKSNEEWSSQLWSQFLQLRKEAWKICRTGIARSRVRRIFHGNIWTQNWPAPNVSGFIAHLVERRTGIARSRVQAPLKSWIFFQASLRNCKNCDHNCEDHSSFDFISAVHIWFISYASFTYISFTGTYGPKTDLLPTSVAS